MLQGPRGEQPELINVPHTGPRLKSSKGETEPEWPDDAFVRPNGLSPLEGLDAEHHPPTHPVYARNSHLLVGTGSITWRDGRVFRGSYFGGLPVTAPGLPVPEVGGWLVELPLFWRHLGADETFSKQEAVRRSNAIIARTVAGRLGFDSYHGQMSIDGLAHGHVRAYLPAYSHYLFTLCVESTEGISEIWFCEPFPRWAFLRCRVRVRFNIFKSSSEVTPKPRVGPNLDSTAT